MNRHSAAWRTRGRGRQAAVALAAAVALGGCSSGAGSARDVANATASSASAARNTPGDIVAALLQVGIRQAEQKSWSAADTTFSDVLAIVPRDVYALYNLGLVDQSVGDPAGAAYYYNQAVAYDGTYTPALYNLAITLESTDQAKALSLYQKIVSINPRASTAYLRMAFVYATQGDLQQATAARAKAIALDPGLAKYQLPAKK
jgi:tetratricopeptide (TPR) repeat protein